MHACLQLDLIYTSIRLLRHHGCNLPVEVWVRSAEWPSRPQLALLEEMGSSVRDIDAVAATFPLMRKGLSPRADEKPFIVKHIALIASSFREVLLLDADNMAARDPTFLFSSPEFVDTGFVMWPDFWLFPRGPADIRAIFDLPQHRSDRLPDERTVESGQLLVDKARAWPGLMLATYLHLETELYDNLFRTLHDLGGVCPVRMERREESLVKSTATLSDCH